MLTTALLIIFVVAPAIILHEVAHGFAAHFLGDDTAKKAGRLTLNPLVHIDPFGTIILPLLLYLPYLLGWSASPFVFGYAKPVPCDFSKLSSYRWGILAVRFAGPLVNVFLAFICGRLLGLGPQGLVAEALVLGVVLNLGLAFFNMIPIPPLDGSGLWYATLPREWLRYVVRLDNMGGIVLVFVLLQLGWLDFLSDWVMVSARMVVSL